VEKIILVRHGEALSPEIDPRKSLSKEGKKSALESAKALFGKENPLEIWHSDKLRAKQTAEIFGQTLDVRLVQKPFLAPNDDPQGALDEINTFEGSLMIVSHLPFLSNLTSLLLGKNIDITFGPSAVVILEREGRAYSKTS